MDHRAQGALPAGTNTTEGTLEVLILQGLPGSGKSTFATALVDASRSPSWSQNIAQEDAGPSRARPLRIRRRWVRASQDDAPNRRRQECEAVVRQALLQGHNVIVDRVNFDPAQRAHFVNIADQHSPRPQVISLLLTASPGTLAKRLSAREVHPTIPDYETAQKVLRQMESVWSPPDPSRGEGLDRILVLPEDGQPLDGVWSEQALVGVLDRAVKDGERESGPRIVRPPSFHREGGRGAHGGGRDSEGGRGGWNGPSRGGYGHTGHSRGGYGGYGQANSGYRAHDKPHHAEHAHHAQHAPANGYARNPQPNSYTSPDPCTRPQPYTEPLHNGTAARYNHPNPYAAPIANGQYRPPVYQPRHQTSNPQ